MTQRSIPVIDLEPYLAGEPGAREAAARAVEDALVDVGFFSIVGHGVPWELVEGIYQQAARYHALDADTKNAHPMTATAMGYVALGGARRPGRPHALNAAFFMGRPGSKRNHFPDEAALPGFRAAASQYYERMDALCHRLLPLYALAAGMPADHFDQFFDPALGTLRLTHYPSVPAEEDQWGIDPHSDAGFMTLLPTNPVAGLQIRPDGPGGSDGVWFDVAQEPRSFVVNSGDTLRRWSNDRFRSTLHRATNRSEGDRYAIPFFFDPRPDSLIECLAGCTDAEHPPRHEPLVYRDYLTTFMGEGYAQLALGTAPTS
jgi:isopenicillin N synthase-like dioxygenase